VSYCATEELNIPESFPEFSPGSNDSSAILPRLIIEMERFDNDQIHSDRRKPELDDLISTTILQLKREIQILEDINNHVLGNDKDTKTPPHQIKLKINKKETFLIDLDKEITALTKLYAETDALEGLLKIMLCN
jgi:hypothetical protein